MSTQPCSEKSNGEVKALNEMTQAELMDEIDALMSADVDDMDTDRLEKCLAILQDRTPVLEDYDAANQLERFRIAASELSESDGQAAPGLKEAKKEKSKRSPIRILRSIEAGIAAALILIITANAFGYAPIKEFLLWAGDVLQVYSTPSGIMELPDDDPGEYHSLESALEANGIDSSGCPNWVPADYALVRVDVKETEVITRYTAAYKSDRGSILIRVTEYLTPFRSEGEEIETGGHVHIHNETEFNLFSNNELTKAVWSSGEFSYVISGQLSEDEIIYMIESIN